MTLTSEALITVGTSIILHNQEARVSKISDDINTGHSLLTIHPPIVHKNRIMSVVDATKVSIKPIFEETEED